MRAHQRVDVLLWLAVLAGMVTVAGACAFSGRRPGDLDDVGSGGHLGAGGYADGPILGTRELILLAQFQGTSPGCHG